MVPPPILETPPPPPPATIRYSKFPPFITVSVELPAVVNV
jgi:hypothetical protein